MALEPVVEAPVISTVPTTPDEIATLGSQLSEAGSAITGYNGGGDLVMPFASSYNWNLSNDFNVNWRTAGPPPGLGTPAAGHLPSCCARDLFVAWVAPV